MADKKRERETEELTARAARAEAADVDPEAAALADEAADAAPAAVVMSGGNISLTFDQLKELLGGRQQLSPEQLVEMATKAAMAGADRVKPKELTIAQTDRKSAFNPEGERLNPRPKLKCHMYFGSAPIGSPKEVTTLTHAEITALNQITPGHYKIKKHDGSSSVIEVKGQMNANRQLDRLWILLPEGEDNAQKNGYPGLAAFAQQCCEANRVQPEVAA